MTGTIFVQTHAAQMNDTQLYGVVPEQQRAETVHSLQVSANVDHSRVMSTLSALAAWKAAAWA